MQQFSLRALLVLVAIIGAVLTVMIQVVSVGRGPDRRSICHSNMRQLAIALQCYHTQWGSFPPACTYDQNGRPMHSWRVLMLPYFEAGDVYARYDFSQPWNSPSNWKAIESFEYPHVFACPSGRGKPGETNYLAVVGDATAWPSAKSVSLSDIQDGAGQTILLVEVADTGIHWAEPRDLPVEQIWQGINPAASKLAISSKHTGLVNVAFCDLSMRSLPEEISNDLLRALLTIAGGEAIPENSY